MKKKDERVIETPEYEGGVLVRGMESGGIEIYQRNWNGIHQS